MQYYCFLKDNNKVTNLPSLSHITNFREQSFLQAFEGTGITEIDENVFANTIYCSHDSFKYMFKDCKSLTKAILPNIIVEDSYSDTGALNNMFNGCSNLSYIKVGFKSWNAIYNSELISTNWVNGVAENGTFVCPEELEQIFDSSHIPPNWTVETY